MNGCLCRRVPVLRYTDIITAPAPASRLTPWLSWQPAWINRITVGTTRHASQRLVRVPMPCVPPASTLLTPLHSLTHSHPQRFLPRTQLFRVHLRDHVRPSSQTTSYWKGTPPVHVSLLCGIPHPSPLFEVCAIVDRWCVCGASVCLCTTGGGRLRQHPTTSLHDGEHPDRVIPACRPEFTSDRDQQSLCGRGGLQSRLCDAHT